MSSLSSSQDISAKFHLIEFKIVDFSLDMCQSFFGSGTYRVVISDADDLIEIVTTFFHKANIFNYALKFISVKMFSTPDPIQIVTEQEFVQLNFNHNPLLCLDQPDLVRALNQKITHLENSIASRQSHSLDQLDYYSVRRLTAEKFLDEKLYRLGLTLHGSTSHGSTYSHYLLIEFDAAGNPVNIALVNPNMLEMFKISLSEPLFGYDGYILGVSRDFGIQTMIYQIGINPLKNRAFTKKHYHNDKIMTPRSLPPLINCDDESPFVEPQFDEPQFDEPLVVEPQFDQPLFDDTSNSLLGRSPRSDDDEEIEILDVMPRQNYLLSLAESFWFNRIRDLFLYKISIL